LPIGDGIVSGTDDGIWSCPVARATLVDSKTGVLPQTLGCSRLAALPFVRRLVRSPLGLLAQQGTRIVRLDHLAAGEALQLEAVNKGAARLLASDGNAAAWLEGDDVVTMDMASDMTPGATESLALPGDAGAVTAIAPGWLCAANGIYRARGGVWTSVASGACLAMVAVADTVWAVEGSGLLRCGVGGNGDSCATAATLPASFAPDGALGVTQDGQGQAAPTLALGSRLYRLAGAALEDVTPVYGGGSLLITNVARIEWPGVLSLVGGGTIVLPPPGGNVARHLRVE
jgi:hypothetical protein